MQGRAVLDAEMYLEDINIINKAAVSDMREAGDEDVKFVVNEKMKARIMVFTSEVARGAQEFRDACAIIDNLMVSIGLPTKKSHKIGLELAFNIFQLTLSIVEIHEIMGGQKSATAPEYEQDRMHKVGCLLLLHVAMLVGCLW